MHKVSEVSIDALLLVLDGRHVGASIVELVRSAFGIDPVTC